MSAAASGVSSGRGGRVDVRRGQRPACRGEVLQRRGPVVGRLGGPAVEKRGDPDAEPGGDRGQGAGAGRVAPQDRADRIRLQQGANSPCVQEDRAAGRRPTRGRDRDSERRGRQTGKRPAGLWPASARLGRAATGRGPAGGSSWRSGVTQTMRASTKRRLRGGRRAGRAFEGAATISFLSVMICHRVVVMPARRRDYGHTSHLSGYRALLTRQTGPAPSASRPSTLPTGRLPGGRRLAKRRRVRAGRGQRGVRR